MSNSDFEALREYLGQIPPGVIPSTDGIADLVAQSWDELLITDTHGMSPDKLDRMEQVRWKPPLLSFEIERHGGTVKGSAYAEVQTWTIDVDQQTGSCTVSKNRLVGNRQARLTVEPLVEQVVHLIEDRMHDERLRWSSDSRVQVLIGTIIPDNAAQQTVAGRRKRFGKHLELALKQRGWELVSGTSPHTYQGVI